MLVFLYNPFVEVAEHTWIVLFNKGIPVAEKGSNSEKSTFRKSAFALFNLLS